MPISPILNNFTLIKIIAPNLKYVDTFKLYLIKSTFFQDKHSEHNKGHLYFKSEAWAVMEKANEQYVVIYIHRIVVIYIALG